MKDNTDDLKDLMSGEANSDMEGKLISSTDESSSDDIDSGKLERTLSVDERLPETSHTRSLQVELSEEDINPMQEGSENNDCVSDDILGALIFPREGGCPHFTVTIETSIDVNAVLDLGAEATVITKELFEQLLLNNPNLQLIDGCAKMYNASNGRVKIYGRCWLNLKFGTRVIRHPVYVCDISSPMLIGADVLWRLSCVIDLFNGVLRSCTKEVTPFAQEWKGVNTVQVTPQVCDVEILETVTVPKLTDAQRIKMRVARNQDVDGKDGTVHASASLIALGLEVIDCIVSTRRPWFWIYVRNVQHKDIVLQKGKRIGKVIALDAPTFDTSILVIGDKFQQEKSSELSPDDSDHTPEWLKVNNTTGTFHIKRLEFQDRPLRSEEIDCCYADPTGLTVKLKSTESVVEKTVNVVKQSQCYDDEVDKAEEQMEIGQSSAEEVNIEEQIEDAVKRAEAADEKQKEQLLNLLLEFKGTFTKGKNDVGCTTLHEVEIPIDNDGEPIYTKQYKIPWTAYDSLKSIIAELESNQIIRPCNSTYNSPVWPVLKSNGTWRMCIDFRNLNRKVPISRWPMGDIDYSLSRLKKSKFFTTLDVANGFWTIPVNEKDQHKLAFTFDDTQYAWTRLPFGYVNSPAEWNIFLHKVLPDIRDRHLSLFVDDVLANSDDWDEHLSQLRYVLEQFAKAGIKVPLRKCCFARSSVDYLGYHLSSEGISPQTKKTQVILNIQDPKNQTQLRSLLGTINFYRRFIKDYAKITEPLTRLLRKGVEWKFGDTEHQILQELKSQLCQAPVLGYPQFFAGAEFIVETACSDNAMSAVLSQLQDGVPRVISYASKGLSTAEKLYGECEKHCFTATWAILHFKPYLCGHHAIVKTSHHPVTFLANKNSELSSRVGKWALVLQSQSFEVQYKKNSNMKHVEGLADLHNCSIATKNSDNGDLNVKRHHKWEAELCENIECVYADGCSFTDENQQIKAGAGVYWPNKEYNNYSQGYSLGKQTSQYAELAAAFIALTQAIDMNLSEVILCTDSEYVVKTFLEYLPRWKGSMMLNSKGKQVKNANIISAIELLTNKSCMDVYWKKVKGHSQMNGHDKDGNDYADSLAKDGAKNGLEWELDPVLVPEGVQYVRTITTNQNQSLNDGITGDELNSNSPATYSFYPTEPSEDLVQAQDSDSDLGPLKQLLEGKVTELSDEILKNNRELRLMYKRKESFTVEKGLLMFIKEQEGCSLRYVVIPKSYRDLFIWYVHDHPTSGHRGIDITYKIAAQSAFWINMFTDIKDYVQRCIVCCHHLPKRCLYKAPLRPRLTLSPWSHVMIDFVGPLVKSARGNQYCLVLVDLFSKYVEALPTRNMEAETVAKMLVHHVFSRWGLPTKMSSDQGTHFTAKVIQELCKMLEIKQNFHISWHPESGGAVERTNKTIMEILKKYVKGSGKDWDLHLPLVLMAMRSTPHSTTDVSPHEVMTGRRMILPHHLVFAYPEAAGGHDSEYSYVIELQENLRHTFAFVRENLEAAAKVNKNIYDRRATTKEYNIGDKVFYFKFANMKKKRKKFLPCWSGPFKVTDKASSVAYQINVNGKKKWVHTNQLRPYFGPAPQHSASSCSTEIPTISSIPSLSTEDTEVEEPTYSDDQDSYGVESTQEQPTSNKAKKTREGHIDQGNIIQARTRSAHKK